MSDNSENEVIEENIEEPLTKPKRPRTQKQMEAFEKVKEKRRANIEAKKEEKLLQSAKLLIEKQTNSITPVKSSEPKSTRVLKEKKKIYEKLPESENEADDDTSEEEIIVVKKSKQKNRNSACGRGQRGAQLPCKVRKIIIEESESSSDDGYDDEYVEPPMREVRKQKPQVIRQNYNDFFC